MRYAPHSYSIVYVVWHPIQARYVHGWNGRAPRGGMFGNPEDNVATREAVRDDCNVGRRLRCVVVTTAA